VIPDSVFITSLNYIHLDFNINSLTVHEETQYRRTILNIIYAMKCVKTEKTNNIDGIVRELNNNDYAVK
jgi:hypothetical protein